MNLTRFYFEVRNINDVMNEITNRYEATNISVVMNRKTTHTNFYEYQLCDEAHKLLL